MNICYAVRDLFGNTSLLSSFGSTMQKIFISAGESSGNLLGANLARALLQKDPTLQLVGMGDTPMENAGVSIIFDSKKLSVVGIVEIITALPTIFLMWYKIRI
mgnify:CR=1 FL=1